MRVLDRLLGAACLAGCLAVASAAMADDSPPQPDMSMHQHHMMMGGGMANPSPGALPQLAGQDAFGAIQEIVAILEADPATDWSKVDIDALRRHLVDMNEVMLKAQAATRHIEGGIVVRVTGTGRTVAAIKRMVPAQAAMIEAMHMNGWSAHAAPLADGVTLTVTAQDPKEVLHIQGLGLFGILASGRHHQMHHLAMAKGEFVAPR